MGPGVCWHVDILLLHSYGVNDTEYVEKTVVLMVFLYIHKQQHVIRLLLSTHANRQSVDISVTVCWFVIWCVCTVKDFYAKDKASSVKFCMAVHRRP